MISSLYANKGSRYTLWFGPLIIALVILIFVPLVPMRLVGLAIGLLLALLAALNVVFGDVDTRKSSIVGVVSALILILSVTFLAHAPTNTVMTNQSTMVGKTLKQNGLTMKIASIEDSGIKTQLTATNPYKYPVNAKIELQLDDSSFPHSVRLVKNVFLNPDETINNQVSTLILSPGYQATKQTQIKITNVTFLKLVNNK